MTYDISKKKKKKKKKKKSKKKKKKKSKKKKKKKNPILTGGGGGGKWGGKASNWGGAFAPPCPPPPWCRHCRRGVASGEKISYSVTFIVCSRSMHCGNRMVYIQTRAICRTKCKVNANCHVQILYPVILWPFSLNKKE